MSVEYELRQEVRILHREPAIIRAKWVRGFKSRYSTAKKALGIGASVSFDGCVL